MGECQDLIMFNMYIILNIILILVPPDALDATCTAYSESSLLVPRAAAHTVSKYKHKTSARVHTPYSAQLQTSRARREAQSGKKKSPRRRTARTCHGTRVALDKRLEQT